MGGEIKASEIINSDPEWWTSYGELRLYDPKITINGNEAKISFSHPIWNGRKISCGIHIGQREWQLAYQRGSSIKHSVSRNINNQYKGGGK